MSYDSPQPEAEVPPAADPERTGTERAEADREIDENQAIAGDVTGDGAPDAPRDSGDTTRTAGPGPTSVD